MAPGKGLNFGRPYFRYTCELAHISEGALQPIRDDEQSGLAVGQLILVADCAGRVGFLPVSQDEHMFIKYYTKGWG